MNGDSKGVNPVDKDTYDKAEFTKKEMWGKNPVVSIFALAMALSTAFLMLYSLHHYQLENSSNPVLFMVAMCVYLMAATICFVFRKKLFPYGAKVPLLRWLGIISVPVPFVMFAIAVFLFWNANLDTHKAYVSHYLVVGKGQDLLVKISPVRQSVIIVPPDIYKSVHKGDEMAVMVSPGFFHQPWIKSYTLQE